eukprot:gene3689-3949_t
MKEVLQEQAAEEAALRLSMAMLRTGLLGSTALGLGWLLHVDVLHTFSTGFLWALPAAALAAVFTVLPLPARPAASPQEASPKEGKWKEFVRVAGAGGLLSLNEVEILHDMKNMMRKFALASDLPI